MLGSAASLHMMGFFAFLTHRREKTTRSTNRRTEIQTANGVVESKTEATAFFQEMDTCLCCEAGGSHSIPEFCKCIERATATITGEFEEDMEEIRKQMLEPWTQNLIVDEAAKKSRHPEQRETLSENS